MRKRQYKFSVTITRDEGDNLKFNYNGKRNVNAAVHVGGNPTVEPVDQTDYYMEITEEFLSNLMKRCPGISRLELKFTEEQVIGEVR